MADDHADDQCGVPGDHAVELDDIMQDLPPELQAVRTPSTIVEPLPPSLSGISTQPASSLNANSVAAPTSVTSTTSAGDSQVQEWLEIDDDGRNKKTGSLPTLEALKEQVRALIPSVIATTVLNFKCDHFITPCACRDRMLSRTCMQIKRYFVPPSAWAATT